MPSIKLVDRSVQIHIHTANVSPPDHASNELHSPDPIHAGITQDDIRFAILVQELFEEYIADKRAVVSPVLSAAQPAFHAIDIARWHPSLIMPEVERPENTPMPLPAVDSVDSRPPPLPFGLAPSGKVEQTYGSLRAITDEDVQKYLQPLYTHGWGVSPTGRGEDSYPQLVRVYNFDTSTSMSFINWICGFVPVRIHSF